ncbi:MAG: TetR/AcrR family transcriptional regulator [Paeniclostridium sordellii]|nr:TetR/AcrR family transcriptional regulator [Paeniclostridium sordellii]
MSNKKSATNLKIRSAFSDLLNEKGINNLTVSDITRKANINRGTFYLHYIDKYDLLEQLENEVLESTKAIFFKYNKENDNDLISFQSVLESLEYVKSNFNLVKGLIEGGDIKFVDKFKDIIRHTLQIKIEKSDILHYKKHNLPKKYADEILLCSIVSVIQLWIKDNALESPREVAEIIQKTKSIAPSELLL